MAAPSKSIMSAINITKSSVKKFPGGVYGLGLASRNAAALYATLTGRPHIQCDRVSELMVSSNDVVVTASSNLTARLMHQLFIASPGSPGLICAATERDLEGICRQQADRALLGAVHQRRRRVFVYPKLSFASFEKGADLFIGGSERTESLLKALSCDAAMLSIVSARSDGIGFNLSLRHFACPFVSAAETGNELLPPCQTLGKCTRFPVPPTIEEARDAGWLIPLSALRAQILLISGCHLVRLQDGIIDPRYGLASTLFSQASCAAMIATWRRELSVPDGVHLNPLLNDIAQGTPVGSAVFTFNQSPLATRMGLNLCVLGDPCVSLGPHLNLPALPTRTISSLDAATAPEPTSISEASLLKDVICAAIGSSSSFDKAKGTRLTARLSSYGTAQAAEIQSQELDDLDSSVLDFLGGTPRLDRILAPFTYLESSSESGTCPTCLAPARSIIISFPKHGARPRRIIRCACCDDATMLPAGWKADLDLSQVNERMIFALVPEGAKVHFCVATYAGTIFTGRGQPALDQAGRYVFHLPHDLPSLPIHCQILIARRLEIGAIRFRMRKMSNGQFSTALPTCGVPAAVS